MAFTTKQDARAATQKSRASRTPAQLVALGDDLAQHDWETLLGGSRVTAYVSMKDEPNTRGLNWLAA